MTIVFVQICIYSYLSILRSKRFNSVYFPNFIESTAFNDTFFFFFINSCIEEIILFHLTISHSTTILKSEFEFIVKLRWFRFDILTKARLYLLIPLSYYVSYCKNIKVNKANKASRAKKIQQANQDNTSFN